jgi:hypothetical protein
MSKRAWWLWSLLVVPAGLKAEEAAAPTEKTEEVFVFADKFARWDRTRWYAEMQIGYPMPARMIATENFEVRATALQLRSQFVCEKTWRRGKRGYEVLCDIEDVSIRATTFEREPNSPDKIFQEMDDKATAAQLRLYVTDDGRVTNIDLDGIPAGLEREQVVRENLRQLYMRLMAGFNLKMPKATQMYENQWVEYGSTLFVLPGMQSQSGGYIVHQVNPYKGHLVVQSIGDALISDGREDRPSYYSVHLDSVSIYRPEDGIMTERAYVVQGMTTAGSPIADGFSGGRYFHSGRVQMLGEKEKVDCGFTGWVTAPEVPAVDGVPVWEAMD